MLGGNLGSLLYGDVSVMEAARRLRTVKATQNVKGLSENNKQTKLFMKKKKTK